ncbi:nucleotidyltransferase domain-containing protein [Phormidium pseudopriestleyi FRX01]|uniref:Nucleotidyltransferase domain-containing protein n=1 Tax=Phormidium pseudopriestleyi FRX01 TaxID=1759528 RepID=A0ABS3FNL2_9CYAN|nr:nucleotidyltransferase domain-containing protein [Phormidium pseudopriestleyi FRX01]
MNQKELLDRLKRTVREVEPQAEIILFGSRARGDAASDSDWDFLILLNGEVNPDRSLAVRDRLYDLEWDCGEVLTSIVRSRQDWQTPLYQSTSFYKSIQQDGICL